MIKTEYRVPPFAQESCRVGMDIRYLILINNTNNPTVSGLLLISA